MANQLRDNKSRHPAESGQFPEPTLRRLPWYLALLTTLRDENIEYISSTRIAKEVGVDASQIAKDLSFLNIKGKTRIGYEVAVLEERLRSFLGFGEQHNAVIVGAGNLGKALMSDDGLLPYGLNIVAGFDVNPNVIGTSINGIPVYDMANVAQVCQDLNVRIATLTVPVGVAQSVADSLIDAGISALWNFTPCRIRVRGNTVVQNTSLYSHLAVMYNRLRTCKKSQ